MLFISISFQITEFNYLCFNFGIHFQQVNMIVKGSTLYLFYYKIRACSIGFSYFFRYITIIGFCCYNMYMYILKINGEVFDFWWEILDNLYLLTEIEKYYRTLDFFSSNTKRKERPGPPRYMIIF